MTPPLPAVALRVLADPDALLVQNRHGRVVHLAHVTRRDLTPHGRLRRGRAPLCGQRARTWQPSPDSPRPLCARCSLHLRRHAPKDALRAASDELTAQQIADALRTATDLSTVEAVVLLICHGRGPLLFEQVPSSNGRHPERLGDLLANTRIRLRRAS